MSLPEDINQLLYISVAIAMLQQASPLAESLDSSASSKFAYM
jgi:hypothetical protein